MEEMSEAIRVHENLSKLEEFVQKGRWQHNKRYEAEKKPSAERSRSGGRARSKSRERRPTKKDKIKLLEGDKSHLSHQNLTTKHQ